MPLALLFLLLFSSSPNAPLEQLDRIEEFRREKRWEEALGALEELRQLDPERYRLNDLPYLEAVIEMEAGNSSSAEGIFSRLREGDFEFEDNVLLHLLGLREKEPLVKREPLYREFLAKYPAHPSRPSVEYRYAVELEEAGRLREAKSQYDSLWRDAPRSWSRRAALGHAMLHVRAGETAEALADLRKLLIKSESDEVAFRAAAEIRRLGNLETTSESDGRRLARTFLNNRQPEVARLYLRRLIDAFPRSLSADQHGYLLGRSFVIEGNYAEALRAYADNYRKHPDSTWGIFSKYLTANTALRDRDYATAERVYREVIRDHPKSKYAGRSVYNLADCYLWLGEPGKAKETLEDGLRRIPAEKRAFRYHLARLYLQLDDWASALGQLERLDAFSSARLPPGVTREEIHYWKGYCLEKLGRTEESGAAYREAAAGRRNYFAYLAGAGNRMEDGPGSPESDWSDKLLRPRPFFFSVEQKREFEGSGPLAAIRTLLFLRLYEEAADRIKRTPSKAFSGANVDRLLNLAYWSDRGSLAAESIAAAELLERTAFAGKGLETYPPLLRSLLYPRHYWDAVSGFGRRHGVEPELILSVIRQESGFRPDALSPAAARGLMQFTRSTARDLARELNLPAPKDPDLYRPDLSIRLGAFYLSKLIRQFDGSVEKALAAYNGGSDNVRRWSAKLPKTDAPLFVANIGYRETKLYVLRVMGNYYAYRSVYGGPSKSEIPAGPTSPNEARRREVF